MSYIQLHFSFLLFQLSPDPTYAEIKKPQPLSLQNDHVPPPIPPYSADDEPSISPNGAVIAQYSVIMRKHMTPDHVSPCNTVVGGDDSTQFVLMREEIKVIK